MSRNIKKRFDDKVSSVVTTNSMTLTPAITALIIASVAKREKKVQQTKSYKDISQTKLIPFGTAFYVAALKVYPILLDMQLNLQAFKSNFSK